MTALERPERESTQLRRASPVLRKLFLGTQGLRVLWRVVLFIAIYQTLELAGLAMLQRWGALTVTPTITVTMALAQESWELVCVAAATGIMAWWERRGLLSFGFIDAFAWIRLMADVLPEPVGVGGHRMVHA